MPVDKANLRKGLEALRTYPLQATGMLRQVTQSSEGEAVYMCALGVLCDASGLGEWEGHIYVVPVPGGEEDAEEHLAPSVAAFYGFDDLDPSVDYDGYQESVSHLNDGEQLTLAEIADLLEATYLRGEDG